MLALFKYVKTKYKETKNCLNQLNKIKNTISEKNNNISKNFEQSI